MKPNGWEKKKMLRDVDLVDEIIQLRKRLAAIEKQRDNALSVVYDLRMDNWNMRGALRAIRGGLGDPLMGSMKPYEIADAALKGEE